MELRELIDFCSHLNTYEGFEDIRFDFMAIDYIAKKSSNSPNVEGSSVSENEAKKKPICANCKKEMTYFGTAYECKCGMTHVEK